MTSRFLITTPPPDVYSFISKTKLALLLQLAREEDMGPRLQDLTSLLLIPARQQACAVMRARVPGVLAGAALLPAVARRYDPKIKLTLHRPDGSLLQPDDAIAHFQGPLRSILAMERIALNFCCHLSGIATLTHRFVSLAAGTPARICDTRKTIPTLRELAKYAVVCGGGVSHRMGLHDAVLVKDNHIAHYSPAQLPQAISTLLARARACPGLKFVEVEVDQLAQLQAVLPCEPDMILLDNMTPNLLRRAVKLRDRLAPRVLLEASGGVNLKTIAAIARTGVDRISIGALTHSAPSLDLGLDIDG